MTTACRPCRYACFPSDAVSSRSPVLQESLLQGFLQLFLGEKLSAPLRPAEGPARLDVVLIEVDVQSGRAVAAQQIFREDGKDEESL